MHHEGVRDDEGTVAGALVVAEPVADLKGAEAVPRRGDGRPRGADPGGGEGGPPRRRTPEDVTVLDAAAFVDADIALHAAVVAAARNPVLTDLFGEFVPALREGLIEMLDLVGMREHDPHTGDDAHAALVRAVADGDADTAGTVLREELEETLALLRRPVTRTPYVPE
ncbi:FCD domain-containing protein [Streptomyces sp. OV198]|uniref:FCD domain-containing protein n=1 Tax=Streptomyces sp. OV198 TaxID=1882787 RepID=UPI00359CB52F